LLVLDFSVRPTELIPDTDLLVFTDSVFISNFSILSFKFTAYRIQFMRLANIYLLVLNFNSNVFQMSISNTYWLTKCQNETISKKIMTKKNKLWFDVKIHENWMASNIKRGSRQQYYYYLLSYHPDRNKLMKRLKLLKTYNSLSMVINRYNK